MNICHIVDNSDSDNYNGMGKNVCTSLTGIDISKLIFEKVESIF